MNKYIFKLRNINISKVDLKYKIKVKSNILNDEEKKDNITNIQTLLCKYKTSIDFLDDFSDKIKCKLIMYDINSNKMIQKNPKHKLHCFWDKSEIPPHVHPLGCPIRKVCNKVKKSHMSHINKEVYSICENVSEKTMKSLNLDHDEYTKQNKSFYFTDGVFCSFNCILAYIKENRHKSIYNNSEHLVVKMYYDIHGTILQNASIAPDWRLLDIFGGYLTIEQFRNNFEKIKYEQVYTLNKVVPIFVPLIYGYKEKIKL